MIMKSMPNPPTAINGFILICSPKSVDEIRIIAERAKQSGLTVLYSQWKLKQGDNIRLSVYKALGEHKDFLVFLGSEEPTGTFKEELDRVLKKQEDNPSIRIIIVLLPGVDKNLWENIFDLRCCIDLSKGLDDPDGLNKLVQAVESESSGKTVSKESSGKKTELEITKEFIRKDLKELVEEGLIKESDRSRFIDFILRESYNNYKKEVKENENKS